MTTSTLAKIATLCSVVIIIGWGVYWGIQVRDTMELIEFSKMQ